MGASTSWWMVIILGVGIVFVGLGLLVLLCEVLRLIFSRVKETEPVSAAAPLIDPEINPSNRKRLLAIASAVIAELEGSDAPGFRIVSFSRRTGL